MSGSMLHGLGDCTPALNCGCMSVESHTLPCGCGPEAWASGDDIEQAIMNSMTEAITEQDAEWINSLGGRMPNILESHYYYVHVRGKDNE